jgi:hypothetical protein
LESSEDVSSELTIVPSRFDDLEGSRRTELFQPARELKREQFSEGTDRR